MRSRLLTWPVLGIGGIVIAAAMFGGGLLAGKALEGNDPAPASSGDSVANQLPRTGPFAESSRDGPTLVSTGRGTDGDDSAQAADEARGGGFAPGIPPSYYGCDALLGDVIQGTSLDPALAGITPRLLGPDYRLIRLSLWAEGDCDEQGGETVGRPVLESTWRHTETGATVSVSQRLLGEPVANVRYETSATVVADGYVFTVNAWNNYYYYDEGARDLPATDGDDSVSAAGIVPPGNQEDVTAVLEAVLAEVAPSVPGNCYYVQTQGDWSDIASLGIGDPRSAIPSGFTESNFNLYTFTQPAASCPDSGAEAPSGNSFWVQWNSSDGREYLEVNVYRNEYNAGEENWPGNLDEWGANWTRNGTSFGVWGNTGKGGLGVDVIEAVARALDPQFSRQCLIGLTPLDPAALAEIGINQPSADGFEIGKSSLNRRGVDPACPAASDYAIHTSYELNWTLESDAGEIQVYAWVSGTDNNSGERWGYAYDGGLEWGYRNRNFSLWGEVDDREGLRDILIEVATSLDPQFDIDDLGDEGFPKPMPVDVDPATSSGSSGAAEPARD
jgi:hypothetical protein